MRRILSIALLVLAVTFVSGLALAGGDHKASKTHDVNVEVVSADVEGKTITIKGEDGESKTVPVLGEAISQLKNVHAGDKVTLTCKDKENGEHEGVTAIKIAKS